MKKIYQLYRIFDTKREPYLLETFTNEKDAINTADKLWNFAKTFKKGDGYAVFSITDDAIQVLIYLKQKNN